MSAGKKRTKKVYPKPEVPGDDRAMWDSCIYCGKSVDPETCRYTEVIRTRRFPVCSESCAAAAETYVRADKKGKTWMYLALFACSITVLIAALMGQRTGWLYDIAILLAGAAFLLLPYPISTFETFQSFPIKRVKLLCRVLGCAFILFAAILFFLG